MCAVMWPLAMLAGALVGGGAGCGSDPPPSCVTVDTSCAPLYAPTFDNIYTMTLRETCGSQLSCHSAQGQAGGMSFQDEQHAFDALRDGRVAAGDPGCSKLIVRTDSPGASYQMPPGSPLNDAARCALIQWVQAGALAGSGMQVAPPAAAAGEAP
jgi:hypothetical protein